MARPQILICCYHKTATVLFRNIMMALGARLGLRVTERFGLVQTLPPEDDIVILGHSLIGFGLARPFRAVRLVRDPRDIWVSGYLYHRHCAEPWCVNTNFDTTPPISFPRVPAAFHHRRERWKRDYLASLGGKSYQENLLDRDRDAGMAFEFDHYTGCTLEDMRAWQLRRPEVREVQVETIARDFDGTMRDVFTHLGFSPGEIAMAMDVAATEDVGRMDDASVAANPHIHGRSLSKWRGSLTPAQLQRIERLYGDVILGLGYKLSDSAD